MRASGKSGLIAAIAGLAFLPSGEVRAQSGFAGNAQHTGNYSANAQNLNAVHWTTSIDLNNTGGFAHYGAPLITPANSVFVPVKTGVTDGFQINVFNGGTGAAIYSLSTDYTAPSSEWIVPYQPVLATNAMETRLYYPGAGGTVYYIDNVDSAAHGAPVRQVFYNTVTGYQANASGFNSTIFVDTPITADRSGNIFFGFRVQGTAPAPLNTSQSGYARIDPTGNGTYVLAGTAAGDSNVAFDSHNAGPAVSNDQSTVYVVVKSADPNSSYAYLLGLDATTLATKYKIFLNDPRGNNANPATILDISTASPMVGPDNDVYIGIFGNPTNGSRGFLLHFSGDLTVEKAPGGFGWDYTPGVVPAGMVPSYTGPSPYLLLTKYNNYANAGDDSADGVNRVALLDPGSTEVDAHASSNGMPIMREVLTVIGPTADVENRSSSLPYAVREWCINTPGVDPAAKSVFFPSEDGNLYRWNLVTNSLDQFVTLNAGLGEPYVPTIVGPDGTVFTLNGGMLSAAGGLTGVGVSLSASIPDVRNGVTGQSITFSVAVSNTGSSGSTPTGTVTLQDTVYSVSGGALTAATTTLASGLPLDASGNASYSTSALTADRHFITASYGGDSSFSAGNSSLIQFVHAGGTITTLTASPNPSSPGQQITLTATVTAAPPASGTPTGQVTFENGTTVIGQVPLNASGIATLSTSSVSIGSNTLTAIYASDTNFSASSGGVPQLVQASTTTTAVSSPNPSVFGQAVTFTSTTTSSGGTPAGSVTFTEGSTVWASNIVVNGSGQASFSTAALAVGSHTITATFTGSAGWGNSSGSNTTMILAVPPFVYIDAPVPNSTLNGVVAIGGWAIENISQVGPYAVASVSVLVDGTQVGTATYGVGRPDVCSAYPNRLGCPNVGWSYNLNVSAFSSGSHTLKIVATDSAGTSGFNQVNFTAGVPPSVYIDAPVSNSTLTGVVAIGGWAIENTSVAGPYAIGSVAVFVDGSQAGTATYAVSRPDVCSAYPNRLGCPNVGWSYNLNASALTPGSHTLTIVATDTAGASGSNQVNFTSGVPPFVYIDAPAPNSTLSGVVAIGGWAIENTSEVGPHAITTVTVFVDGTQVGTATYGVGRPDVCTAYPNRPGCPDVGWGYNLNVSSLSSGAHRLTIVATDSAGNASANQVTFSK